MTAPLTAERRAAIEGKLSLLDAGGMTASASMLRDLIAEIDRLTAERDAAVAAAVMAERDACAAICDAHPAAMLADRERKRQGRQLPPEAWEAITAEEEGEKIAAAIIAKAIRSRPAPAPAVPTVDAEMLAALKAALPQAEGCWANHYGDNPEGGAVPEHIQMMRDAIARVEGRTPAHDDADTLEDGDDRDFEAWMGDRP